MRGIDVRIRFESHLDFIEARRITERLPLTMSSEYTRTIYFEYTDNPYPENCPTPHAPTYNLFIPKHQP
jgi:hypothetical protein